jgi:excisionase family DNA binding protein
MTTERDSPETMARLVDTGGRDGRPWVTRQSLLTMPEVAQFLCISVQRAYPLAREGILRAVHLGRQVRVDPETLGSWIKRGGSGPPRGSGVNSDAPDPPRTTDRTDNG